MMDEHVLREKLRVLIVEHRDLDAAIDSMLLDKASDQLKIQRLKKRKLSLKDQISKIEDLLLPDIIA